MSVSEKMTQMRSILVERDRVRAMEAVTDMLYYKIAPLVADADTISLFESEEAVAAFCREKSLDERALNWLFENMREEGLLTSGPGPIMLTPLGIVKFCMEE